MSNLKHGLVHTREFNILANMKMRCYNKKNPAYKYYGARGIGITKKWLAKNGIINFISDMGLCPSKKHSLDRIDNERGYSKENCRWTDSTTQANNTRKNIFIKHKDKTLTISQWSRETGLKYRTIHDRHGKGWPVEKIFKQPNSKQREV